MGGSLYLTYDAVHTDGRRVVRRRGKLYPLGLTLGERVRWCRQESRMTQGELAALAGYRCQSLSALENDRRKPPAHVLRALARATGYSARWLIEGDSAVVA